MGTKLIRIAIAGAMMVLAAGCSDEPLRSPSPAEGASPSYLYTSPASLDTVIPIPAHIKDVPAVRMDLPLSPRPWDSDPTALVSAATATGGRVIIAFKEQGSPRVLNGTGRRNTRAAVGGQTIRGGLEMMVARGALLFAYYPLTGAAYLQVDPALLPQLVEHPLIDYIEPIKKYRVLGEARSARAIATLTSSQVLYWGIQMVRAPDAWTVTRGGGVRIAMLDTGFDRQHSDLPQPPSPNCFGEYFMVIECDDGDNPDAPWHGTRVLGVWTARDNTFGTVGVAPGVEASNVYMGRTCDPWSGDCPTSWIINGLDGAVSRSARVVNMSFGSPTYDGGLANAVAQAWNAGVIMVAAAGNNGIQQVEYPAGHDNVIGVSGVNQNKTFAGPGSCPYITGSNYGTHVDLAAPVWAHTTFGPDTYIERCSTSLATPYVSGAAALVISAHPTWSKDLVIEALFNTADRSMLTGIGKDQQYGYGIVDAYGAVTYSGGGGGNGCTDTEVIC